MSAEEADKATSTDATAGDEEEEWLYGGQWAPHLQSLRSVVIIIQIKWDIWVIRRAGAEWALELQWYLVWFIVTPVLYT